MDLLSFGRSTQTGMEVFEYEDLIREENLKDPQFLYATLSESLDAYMITNLQPNTNYAVAINVQVKYGTIMNNPIHYINRRLGFQLDFTLTMRHRVPISQITSRRLD